MAYAKQAEETHTYPQRALVMEGGGGVRKREGGVRRFRTLRDSHKLVREGNFRQSTLFRGPSVGPNLFVTMEGAPCMGRNAVALRAL